MKRSHRQRAFSEVAQADGLMWPRQRASSETGFQRHSKCDQGLKQLPCKARRARTIALLVMAVVVVERASGNEQGQSGWEG